jgi:hypothetical protein
MGVGKQLEETYIQAADARFVALDERRELVVVADENECSCKTDWAETDWQRDLGGFVHDAVVERALVEDGVVDS